MSVATATINAEVKPGTMSKPAENTVVRAAQPSKPRGAAKPSTGDKSLGVYYQALLSRRLALPIATVGGNVRQLLEEVANKTYGGKCGPEGYVKPGSVKVMEYSAPMLKADSVVFQATFECLVCNPVEGMVINAVAKRITKAGIRAEVPDGSNDEHPPMVIFVSRDHHFQSEPFNNVNIGDNIQVKIIGVRFMLNDDYVSAIAQLVERPQVAEKPAPKRKPRLVIQK